MIPYGRQSISQADVAAVSDSLTSGWLTTGPKVEEFENQFSAYVGAKYAVAVNNGTSALHLAMLVAEIGPGDRVVTSPNTFLSSANCAAFVGATPDFSDIEADSYNLDASRLASDWIDDTKAVVAVDYAGQPCDMPTIYRFASERGAIVIEDACHAVGGGFVEDNQNWKVGGHPWADITTFSFHPVKSMTSGEGGILVTDRLEYAERARQLRNHGMVRDAERFIGLSGDGTFQERGPWYYEMQGLGHNFRITDFQCALAISQLSRLDEFVLRRRLIVARYNEAFHGLATMQTPKVAKPANGRLISWHLYTGRFDFLAIGKNRTQVMRELSELGVGTQVLYIPVYLQPWYRRQYGYDVGKCPVAEQFYESALSLPLYPALSDNDVEQVIDAVLRVCGGNSR
jgi:UDP-4-amino-4,6-dideoxy-N-acetyl-beta-L-altrosamine transaminase